jgi:hypothetical protein
MPNAHTNALLDQLVDDTVSVMTIISTEPPTTTDPESQLEENNKAAEAPETSQTITNNEVSAQDDDDDGEGSEEEGDPEVLDVREKKILHWKESPFAVGCVNVTWEDDRMCCKRQNHPSLDVDPQVAFSASCCGCLGAGRVGNMVVLAQTMEDYDHIQVNEETGAQTSSRRKRPKLHWVMGPYWPVNLCLTYPLILGISFWTAWKRLPDAHIVVILTWSLCTFMLIFALAMVACRNPGILYRHNQAPPGSSDWRWNDQARTFRPPKSRFDPECQAMIEGFDHT